MGYRKIDPRTKAAAIKAMRKAVEAGVPVHTAARELSPKYSLAPSTLQSYYTEATRSATERPGTDEPGDSVIEFPAHEVALAEVSLRRDDSHLGIEDTTPVSGASAGATPPQDFPATLETLSREYVQRLQTAVLDDLIAKMQALRDQLRP